MLSVVKGQLESARIGGARALGIRVSGVAAGGQQHRELQSGAAR